MLVLARLPLLIVVFFALAFAVVTQMPRGATSGLVVGVNCSKNPTFDADSCKAIGTSIARVEFDINNSASSLDTLLSAYASRGIQVQLLAGFHGRTPTAAESANLRNWALRFGPGGSFWQGRNDGQLAVRNIEFGNETSMGWQYGDDWSASSYSTRAHDYGARAQEAVNALQGTNVGLLVQAEDGGSGSSNWVNQMFAAAPNLDDLVAGWIIHPYGPRGYEKIDRMYSQLGAVGASTSTPFYATEWGVASDNGRTLNDNYGYPTNTTYDQAAQILRDTIATWKSRYGARFQQLIIYQNADQQQPGASNDREGYFGIMRKDTVMKGAYATEVRAQVTGNTAPNAAPAAAPAPTPAPPPTTETGTPSRPGAGKNASPGQPGGKNPPDSIPTTYLIEWDGRLFQTAGELRSYLTARGVVWATFLALHPAVAEQIALPFVVWNGKQFYDRASFLEELTSQGISYRQWAANHPDAAAILAGRSVASTRLTPARALVVKNAVFWAGIGFTTAQGLRTYTNQQRLDWNVFLTRHPKLVQHLKLASVTLDGKPFFSRAAISRWLKAHHSTLASWSAKHPGVADKLMA